MTGANATQNVPFKRGHPVELTHPITAPNGGYLKSSVDNAW
jgi:hypothetical protein